MSNNTFSVKYPQIVKGNIIFPPLPKKEFQIIYADPPWHYGGKRQHEGSMGKYAGGCLDFYPCIPTKELAKLEIEKIAGNDCLLFMWATSPHLDQAISLGKAWGFDYSTVAFVWDKQLHNPGRYTISQCELCLLFKKGKIPSPRGKRNVKQFFSQKRRAHSVKPNDIREKIVEMFPSQDKVELFAREKFDTWYPWGTEVV